MYCTVPNITFLLFLNVEKALTIIGNMNLIFKNMALQKCSLHPGSVAHAVGVHYIGGLSESTFASSIRVARLRNQ